MRTLALPVRALVRRARPLVTALAMLAAAGCAQTSAPAFDVVPPDAAPDATQPPPDTAAPDAPAPDAPPQPTDARRPDDLIVRGVGLNAYEGQTLYLVVENTAVGMSTAPVSVIITSSGAFDIRVPEIFDRDLFGMLVHIYVDANRDGRCTAPTDASWTVFANNDFAPGMPVTVEFDPRGAMMNACEGFR